MTSVSGDLRRAVRNIALRAAVAVQAIQNAPEFTVESKGEAGPLTSADLMADAICRRELALLDPRAGLLSEETGDDLSRLEKSRVWIIDPIDGTREFVKRIPEYAVSIGLSVDGRPVLGAIAMPAQNRVAYGGPELGLFLDHYTILDHKPGSNHKPGSDSKAGPPSSTGPGALELPGFADFYHMDGGGSLPRGDVLRLQLQGGPVEGERRPVEGRQRPLALVSRSEAKKGKFKALENDYRIAEGGSIARKLAQVALGEGDLNFSVYPKNEWDICGGIALVLARPGYQVTDLADFQPHRFNRRDTRSYGLVAGPEKLVREFAEYFRDGKLKLEKRYD